MSIIKHNGKFYKEINLEELSKEELLDVVNWVEEVPKKEFIKEHVYLDKPDTSLPRNQDPIFLSINPFGWVLPGCNGNWCKIK